MEESKVKSADTNNCIKCGGRTALVSGYWYYRSDEEPYENGVHEKAVTEQGEEWLYGFICDDCEQVQGMWIDEPYVSEKITDQQSRITELEANEKESMKLIVEQSASIIDLMHQNEKLKEYSNTFKCLQLEAQNKELREALTQCIYSINEAFSNIVEVAEQALKKEG